MYLAFFQF